MSNFIKSVCEVFFPKAYKFQSKEIDSAFIKKAISLTCHGSRHHTRYGIMREWHNDKGLVIKVATYNAGKKGLLLKIILEGQEVLNYKGNVGNSTPFNDRIEVLPGEWMDDVLKAASNVPYSLPMRAGNLFKLSKDTPDKLEPLS